MSRHYLANVEAVKTYMRAGRARFRIYHSKSRLDIQYKIIAKTAYNNSKKQIYFVYGFGDEYLGYTYDFCKFIFGERKSKVRVDSPQVILISGFMEELSFNRLQEPYSFWFDGRCARCGGHLRLDDEDAPITESELGLHEHCAEGMGISYDDLFFKEVDAVLG